MTTTIIERLQDDKDFVETLQDLFGDVLVSETNVLPEIPIPQSQETIPAGPSTLPCDAPVGLQKAKGKKKQFNLHPSPCKFYLCKTLGVKPNGIFYSENTTNDVLKHFCRLNNLAVGGKKVELIGRLQAHFWRYGLNVDSQLKVLTWTSQGKPLPMAQEVQQIQDTVRAQNVLSKMSQKRKQAENDTGNGDTDIPAWKEKNTVDDSMRQSNQLGLHTIIFSNAVASESWREITQFYVSRLMVSIWLLQWYWPKVSTRASAGSPCKEQWPRPSCWLNVTRPIRNHPRTPTHAQPLLVMPSSLSNTRFSAGLPYTWLGTSHLLAINRCKVLSTVNNASVWEYEDCCYRDTGLSPASAHVLQPCVSELTTQMYLLMWWQRELQALVMQWVVHLVLAIPYLLTDEVGHTVGLQAQAKHTTHVLLINFLFSHPIPKGSTVSNQIAPHPSWLIWGLQDSSHRECIRRWVLDQAVLQQVWAEGRWGTKSAKMLVFVLNKSGLTWLIHEERTFHIFYQLSWNQALHMLLDSFGDSKTLLSANASCHGHWLELHFNECGWKGGWGRGNESAKVLAFALYRSGLTWLIHEERTFQIFYQLSWNKALYTLLDSFGNSKAFLSMNASHHGHWLELHFNEHGRQVGGYQECKKCLRLHRSTSPTLLGSPMRSTHSTSFISWVKTKCSTHFSTHLGTPRLLSAWMHHAMATGSSGTSMSMGGRWGGIKSAKYACICTAWQVPPYLAHPWGAHIPHLLSVESKQSAPHTSWLI